MTTQPNLIDPPEDEPAVDWRNPEHQADVVESAFRRGLADAREALKAANPRKAR